MLIRASLADDSEYDVRSIAPPMLVSPEACKRANNVQDVSIRGQRAEYALAVRPLTDG